MSLASHNLIPVTDSDFDSLCILIQLFFNLVKSDIRTTHFIPHKVVFDHKPVGAAILRGFYVHS